MGADAGVPFSIQATRPRESEPHVYRILARRTWNCRPSACFRTRHPRHRNGLLSGVEAMACPELLRVWSQSRHHDSRLPPLLVGARHDARVVFAVGAEQIELEHISDL